jgi:hypothetical protein
MTSSARASNKMAALRSLGPDIAILSESACPEQLRRKLPELADVPMLWVGDNVHKGLAVVSFTGSDSRWINPIEPPTNTIAPVQVTGQKSFRLPAMWDHNDRKEG